MVDLLTTDCDVTFWNQSPLKNDEIDCHYVDTRDNDVKRKMARFVCCRLGNSASPIIAYQNARFCFTYQHMCKSSVSFE